MMDNQHLGNDLRMKAQDNAQPLHASGKSVAFSIESIATVLLLFIVLAVVVQFFGGAFVSTQRAHGQMNATVTARQVAEEFQAAISPQELAEALDASYDEQTSTIDAQVEYVSGVSLPVTVSIDSEQHANGTLYQATIEVGSDEDPSATCKLSSTHYVQGGVR